MEGLSPVPPSDPPAMQRSSQDGSVLWNARSSRRVSQGILTGFAVGSAYATMRALPPSSILRAGISCGALAAPFFALREIVAVNAGVDGPVASAITGGVAGYVGALFVAGPHWKTVTHSALAVGMGCGVIDFVVSGLNAKRKSLIVDRQDAAAEASTAQATVNGNRAGGDGVADEKRVDGQSWWRWHRWFPVLRDMDEEYHELLRRQKATVIALDEEQARIATLLEALEHIKAGSQNRSAELSDGEDGIVFGDDEGVFISEDTVSKSRTSV